jgi:hypothetical protein
MQPSPTANAAVALPQSRSADRFIAAIRVALIIALTALVLAIAALAYVVSFEAIRAFAVETAAFPAELAWSAPLLVDSFTTAASLVILWRYLRGDHWYDPWYAWTLVAAATAVSVALNVVHAPRPARRPALRRPATRRTAGSAGAADERGPLRPAAHQPRHRQRDRGDPHCDPGASPPTPAAAPPTALAGDGYPAPPQSPTATPHPSAAPGRGCRTATAADPAGPRCGSRQRQPTA